MSVFDIASTEEGKRLAENGSVWRGWGPYLSERSWGTVREDYSPDGNAWAHLTHDMARSKAYRWGEDGLAGISDRYQLLCWGLALWNGEDPILKERVFGLTPSEGNHGEDAKDYYFYVDSTPTHSYMRYLYKYPQAEFPYQRLIEENQSRSGQGDEFELLDTGIFDEDRYFDVVVEFAKVSPNDIFIRIEAFNRAPDAAVLHIIPNLWFRNIWSFGDERGKEPIIRAHPESGGKWLTLVADDTEATGLGNLPFEYKVGSYFYYADPDGVPLFTDNESNDKKLFGVDCDRKRPFVKDAFHRYIIDGEKCVNPENIGTKNGIHYCRHVPGGQSTVVALRLCRDSATNPLSSIDDFVSLRRKEADEFYDRVHPSSASEDERLVQRQAFAGMMWTKQCYIFDVDLWLKGDSSKHRPPDSRWNIRNQHWRHLKSMRLLSMPDKWEYPWFAAWDLAFHTIPIALIDPEFAKEQLLLMLFEQFQHPNGQIPAYEWEFSDLNPPVHAWAVWRVYNMDRIRSGKADVDFLEKCFHKLMLNFTWWVNKVDKEGNNVFEGGFLGLDNITVFDRSEKLPEGLVLEQSDATGWMGMFSLNLMRIALELAKHNPVYEGLATKYFQHYIYVGAAMKSMGGKGYHLWDECDGFFYDVLRYPDGGFQKLKVRSLVGLVPLFAIERLEHEWIKPFKEFTENMKWFVGNRQDVVQHTLVTLDADYGRVSVLSVVDREQLERMLRLLWDNGEFRSRYGLRSMSKFHEKNPFVLGDSCVRYEPAEAESKLKGGNSNWRGPIWFPTSFLMIESLRKLRKAYGGKLRIVMEDGEEVNIEDMTRTLANSMIDMFIRNEEGKRPIYGDVQKFQEDPYWRDLICFFEYFHGDTGQGLGASHQTGWTGLVACLIDEWRR
jgi:hypothetical protein